MKSLQSFSFARGSGPELFQGTFKRLLEPDTFAAELYPGMPKTVRKDLPGDIGELLQWRSVSAQLTDMIPKMTKSASDILQNVKSKGLAKGSVMSGEEESLLLPQIVQGMISEY
jgi:hypothetical protein